MSIKDEPKDQNLKISKTIIIEASPEIVFKAITEPEELTQWSMGDQALLEPRVGGKVRFITLKETHQSEKLDRDYIMEGIVLELVPNKKLSYTWSFKDLPDFPETTVVWELEEIEPNKTKVQLTHLGFTGKEKGLTSVDRHNEGWAEVLNKLAKYCKGRE